MRAFFLSIPLLVSCLTVSPSFGQNFIYNTIELENVMFSGDTLKVLKDGLNMGYSGYHWSSTPGVFKPAAYTANTKPRVTAQFKWTCATAPDSVYIMGSGPSPYNFPAIKVPVQDAGSFKRMTYPATYSTSIFEVGKVQYFENFNIEWAISYNGVDWSPIGESETELFVVKNIPMVPKTNFNHWHTVYYLSCKNAHGLSDEGDIIEALFTEFEDQMVLNHNDDTLRYYQNMASSNVTLPSLLLNKDAQCFTFAQLFLAMIKIQGIVRTNNYLNITPINNTVCGKIVNRFIVKNWTPTGLMTSSCPSFPYLNTYVGSLFNPALNAYNFSYTEMADADGIPGPANINPSSYFNNHQIAHVDGVFYDACYGVKYNTLADYTANSINGWSYRVTTGSTNDCYFTTDLSLSSFSESYTTF